MISYENSKSGNIIKAGLASAVAAVALTGCSSPLHSSGNKHNKIPDCEKSLTYLDTVKDQFGVIAAYEDAGQRLFTDYRELNSGSKRQQRIRVTIAVNQLFNLKDKSGGLLNVQPASSGKLTPESYLADDPAEIFCATDEKDPNGKPKLALSTVAEQARVILRNAGDPVLGLNKLVDKK